ncbi:MAG: ABC transporter permease [Methylococcales bacterium]
MAKCFGLWLGGLWLAALVLGAAGVSWLLPDPLAVDLDWLQSPPGLEHLGGTDELGRDVLARVLHAARPTLLVTAGATALDIVLALLLGMLAAYRGGWADRLLGLAIDFFWSVPFVVFVVLIISLTGVSIASLILTIGGINWVTAARVIRAETGPLRNLPFIQAAQAFGFSSVQIIVLHLLPALRLTVLTLAAYTAIEVLTLETGLAFIGLSLPAPTPTWGGILAGGLNYLGSAWWLTCLPAAAVTLTLISLQSIGRGMEQSRYDQ